MKMNLAEKFPFGLPVQERMPQITAPRRAYILGTYPSALHVYWKPPIRYQSIQAFAVDNEPDFFWNGNDEAQKVEDWKARVGFQPAWGSVMAAGRLNGSSGLWVDENILSPLHLARGSDVWISDCLTTYRTSDGQSKRIADTYQSFAERFDLPMPVLSKHPSEDEVVREALAEQKSRLLGEIESAGPELIVTLGNAALRVFSQLVTPAGAAPTKLIASVSEYGQPVEVTLRSGKRAVWYPLVHPGQRAARFVNVHDNWLRKIT